MPCPLVLVGANLVDKTMTPVFKQIQLALFLSCSVSPIIICSILHCVVTIFCSCVVLRDHVLLPYVITGVCIHCALLFSPQWYAFVSHNGVQLAKISPTKALFYVSTLVLDHVLLSPSDQGRCSCQLL